MSQYVVEIPALATLIVDVLVSDRDMVLVISGYPGVGKSVLNYLLAVSITEELRKRGMTTKAWNPVKNLLFHREEFKNWVETAEEYEVGSADEAVGIFYSRDYHDETQIVLLKKLDRVRDRHLVMSLLIPNFFHVDKHIRDSRVMYWIHVDTRRGKGKDGYAHAYIFQKDDNPMSTDPWNLGLNRKLWGQHKIHDSPNYVGEIVYKDMHPAIYALYKKIKGVKREIAEIKEWSDAQTRKRRWGSTGEKFDKRVGI